MTTTFASHAENPLRSVIDLNIRSWNLQNKAVTDFFNLYEDDYYLNEVAPGKNRAVYLLGHLIASSDNMLPLFGLGERLYPAYEEIFALKPDRAFDEIPSVAELKKNWSEVNTALAGHFSKIEPADWLDRHTKVSAEDFARQPERNKLNVLMGRTSHISYHMGQLVFLKK